MSFTPWIIVDITKIRCNIEIVSFVSHYRCSLICWSSLWTSKCCIFLCKLCVLCLTNSMLLVLKLACWFIRQYATRINRFYYDGVIPLCKTRRRLLATLYTHNNLYYKWHWHLVFLNLFNNRKPQSWKISTLSVLTALPWISWRGICFSLRGSYPVRVELWMVHW